MSFALDKIISQDTGYIYNVAQIVVNNTIYIGYNLEAYDANWNFLGYAIHVVHCDLNYNNIDDHKIFITSDYVDLVNIDYDKINNVIKVYYYIEAYGDSIECIRCTTIDLSYNVVNTETVFTFDPSSAQNYRHFRHLVNKSNNNNNDSNAVFVVYELVSSQVTYKAYMKDGSIKTWTSNMPSDNFMLFDACNNPYTDNDIAIVCSNGDNLILKTSEEEYNIPIAPHGMYNSISSVHVFEYNGALYVVYYTEDSIVISKIIKDTSYSVEVTHQTSVPTVEYANKYSITSCIMQDGAHVYFTIGNLLYTLVFTDTIDIDFQNTDTFAVPDYSTLQTDFAGLNMLNSISPILNDPKGIRLLDNIDSGIFAMHEAAVPYDISDSNGINNDDNYDGYYGPDEYGDYSGYGNYDKTKIYLELQSANSTKIKIPFTVPTPRTADGSPPQWNLQFRCKIYADEACTDLIEQLDTINNIDSFKLENGDSFPTNGLPPSKYGTKCFVSANIRPVNKVHVALDYGSETY